MTAIQPKDLQDAAQMLRIDLNVLRAIDIVESNGSGFDKLGRVKILFEPFTFNRMTNRLLEGLSVSGNLIAPKFGDRSTYSLDQHQLLKRAMDLVPFAQIVVAKDYTPPDENKAIRLRRLAKNVGLIAQQSCSWGRYQIMGFNYKAVGYRTVQAFVKDMETSEVYHLRAFCAFLVGKKLDAALREKRYDDFFRGYNGPAYKKLGYDRKFHAALRSVS